MNTRAKYGVWKCVDWDLDYIFQILFLRFIVLDVVHSYDKNRHEDNLKADRVSTFELQPDCCHARRQQAGLSGRAGLGVGLRPLFCWDCGFEPTQARSKLSYCH